MLPGNLQYWQPCRWHFEFLNLSYIGTKDIKIIEPIHFSGPSPGDNSAMIEEDKKEKPINSQPDQHLVADQDDPKSAAQQKPLEMINAVQRPIEEEKKQPEPHQTVQSAGGANMSTPSVNAHPRVNQQPIDTAQQPADPN